MRSELSVDDWAELVCTTIKTALAPFHARVKGLEERVAAAEVLRERIAVLEARLLDAKAAAPGGVQWAGIYKANTPYDEGRLVTHAGGLWISTRTTGGRPGGEDSGWTLVCKSGSFAVRGAA
jgi:hypothetical protein